MLYYKNVESFLGEIILCSDGNNLTGLCFKNSKYFAYKNINAVMDVNLAIFMQTEKWLEEYFLGKEPLFTPAIKLQGTAFQICIWKLLLTIPYGKCLTYGKLADEVSFLLGKQRMSAQAVGRAISCNPICIIVPCHRVIGANGSLTGYSGGIIRKAELLKLEAVSDIAILR